MKCKFNVAYMGPCGSESDNGFCNRHSTIKCCVCGSQATHECCYTGKFVCGAPLCDGCTDGDSGNSDPGLGWGFMSHIHQRKVPQ